MFDFLLKFSPRRLAVWYILDKSNKISKYVIENYRNSTNENSLEYGKYRFYGLEKLLRVKLNIERIDADAITTWWEEYHALEKLKHKQLIRWFS